MKYIVYWRFPLLMPHFICYNLFSNKELIYADMKLYAKSYNIAMTNKSGMLNLAKVLLICPEFRNIFYCRVGKISAKLHVRAIMHGLLPPYRFLSIGMQGDNIGKGFFIEHGNSTIIHAKSIGDNFWANQNVTVGDNGRGIPEIGDNVRLGVGAVVLGPIKVGNNVIIGANATIVKDVPDNCTVVSSTSYIIKRNGIKVREML